MHIQNKIKIIQREKISDSRGWFLKIMNGFEKCLPSFTGEIYVTSAISGQIKGGHYHLIANEWFFLIKGKCKLKLFDVDEMEYYEMILDEYHPITIFIPSRIAHAFENISHKDFILIAYMDRLFDPSDTIKFNFSNE